MTIRFFARDYEFLKWAGSPMAVSCYTHESGSYPGKTPNLALLEETKTQDESHEIVFSEYREE